MFHFGVVFVKTWTGGLSGRNFSSEWELMFLVNITDAEGEPDPRLPDVNLITRMSIGGEYGAPHNDQTQNQVSV